MLSALFGLRLVEPKKGSNLPLTHINRIMYLPYLVLEFFCHIFKVLSRREVLYRKIFGPVRRIESIISLASSMKQV